MARGFVHAVVDLIAFGMPYLSVHQRKDAAARILGSHHRTVDHPWYWQFGTSWTFSDPFPAWLRRRTSELANVVGPDDAEVQQVNDTHEYLDRVWDDLPGPARKDWEGFMVWVVLHPTILKTWAGVDVRVGALQRVVDGREIWEKCEELKHRCDQLKRYAKFLKWKDPALREMVSLYGQAHSGVVQPSVDARSWPAKHRQIDPGQSK